MDDKSNQRLHVLGCGDAFSSGGQNHTSFLLQTSNSHILIDCGASTPMALKRAGFSFKEIDYIVLSHFHGDHYGGLPYLILEGAKALKRKKPLTIVSPPGLEDRLQKLLHLLYPGSEDALDAFPINYVAYESGRELEQEHFVLKAFEVEHAKATLPHGLRLELGKKVFAYSGDTGWHENLPQLAQQADLFICECNFFDEEMPSHLNYKDLQEKLPLLDAKRIRLTHLGENMLKKKEQLEMEVLEDGQVIEF